MTTFEKCDGRFGFGVTTFEKAPTTCDSRCGTEAGWVAHRRRNEKPCRSCIRGAADARLKRKRKATGGPKDKHNTRCRYCGWFLPNEDEECKNCHDS